MRLMLVTEWCDLVLNAHTHEPYVSLWAHDSLKHDGVLVPAKLGKVSVARVVAWLQEWLNQGGGGGEPDLVMQARWLEERVRRGRCQVGCKTLQGGDSCQVCLARSTAALLVDLLTACEVPIVREVASPEPE